ncbi:hypothetical protein S245_017064 [Arachis hypogaea]
MVRTLFKNLCRKLFEYINISKYFLSIEFWPKAFSFLHSSPIRHQVQKQPSFSSIGITIAPPSLRLLTPPSRSVAAVPLSLLLLAPPVALLLPRRLAPSLCCRRGSSYFGPSPFSLNRAHKNQSCSQGKHKIP